jgi:coenzyme F420 hydrogenase subunit beta
MKKHLIHRDLCTRCGACFAADTSSILSKDSDGFPIHAKENDDPAISRLKNVCSGENWNYVEWLRQLYGTDAKYDPSSPDIGIHKAVFLLTSNDSRFREFGQSGGVTTTLLRYGMEKEIISAALAVRRPISKTGNPFSSEPFIARSIESLTEAAGSKYTICSTLELVRQISQEHDAFAITTLPCQTAGFRKLATELDPSLFDKCKIIIGPYCGLNMETIVGEELARAASIDPDKIHRFQNRGGQFPGETTFEEKTGKKHFVDRTAHRILYRMYSPLRCYTCTDFGNELADIAVADCWERDKDGFKYPEGAAYVICRTKRGLDYVRDALQKGYLQELPIDEAQVKKNWEPSFLYRKVRAHNRIRYWNKKGRYVPKLDYPLPSEFKPSHLADQIEMKAWQLFRIQWIRSLTLSCWLHLAKAPIGSYKNLIFEDCKKFLFTHTYDQHSLREYKNCMIRHISFFRQKISLSAMGSLVRKIKKMIPKI